MNHCTSCGAELQPHWKFCTNCRAPQPAPDGAAAAKSDAPQDSGAAASAGVVGPGGPGIPAPAAQPAPTATLAKQGNDGTASGFASPGGPGTFDGAGHDGGAGNNGGNWNNGGAGHDGGGNRNNDGGIPGGPGTPASGGRKPSRRMIVLAAVLAVLVALGIGAFFFVQNMLRGGAGSAQGAADKLLESIESKDLVGVVTMVPPDERDPLQRMQEQLEDKFEEFRIGEALEKVGRGDEEDEEELTLDGISLTFENVRPEITEVDDSTALITYAEGTLRYEVDPAATTGALRSLLESTGDEDEDKIEETVELSELGPDESALTLVATERDGRWYVSPLYSVIEMINDSEGYDRGTVPESSGGSDSPAEAATAMVEALPKVASEGSLEPLAGTLSIHEGSLFYLYQDMFSEGLSAAGEDVSISDIRFSKGAKDGDRAVAVVENITVENGAGDKITLGKDCIKGDMAADSICFTGSGYSIEPSAQMAGGARIMSLTTVKEDGKWRVSMGHTVADWLINWTDSLTREQALALMQLARSEDASADITVGESTEVEFNSAGYAVLNLTVDDDTALAAEDEYDFGTISVYSADGKDEITTLGYGDEVPAGEYKLVVFAGTEWDEQHAEEGNSLEYSADLTLVEDEPYSFSYAQEAEESVFGLLPLGAESQLHTLAARSGSAELVFEVEGPIGPEDAAVTVVVLLDGKEHKLEVRSDKPGTLSLPYPGDGEEHELEVELQADAGLEYALLHYTAEFK